MHARYCASLLRIIMACLDPVIYVGPVDLFLLQSPSPYVSRPLRDDSLMP